MSNGQSRKTWSRWSDGAWFLLLVALTLIALTFVIGGCDSGQGDRSDRDTTSILAPEIFDDGEETMSDSFETFSIFGFCFDLTGGFNVEAPSLREDTEASPDMPDLERDFHGSNEEASLDGSE